MNRVLTAGGSVLLGVAIAAAPARATSCAGPIVEHAGEVDRGGELTVTGRGFGDNCYDTMGPPHGEGTLGKPRTDIEVVISQLDQELVVARGDAGPDYTFRATIEVPIELQAGLATVFARWDDGDTVDYDDNQLLLVSDVGPGHVLGDPVASFDPSAQRSSVDDPAAEGRWTDCLPAMVGVTVLAALLSWVLARRVRKPT